MIQLQCDRLLDDHHSMNIFLLRNNFICPVQTPPPWSHICLPDCPHACFFCAVLSSCRLSLHRQIAVATARFLLFITHILFLIQTHLTIIRSFFPSHHCYRHCHCCHQIDKLDRSCANRANRLSTRTTRTKTSPGRRHRPSFYHLPPSALCFFIQSSKPSSVLDTPN